MEVSQEMCRLLNCDRNSQFGSCWPLSCAHFSCIRPIKMYDADVALPLVVSLLDDVRADSGEIDI